MSVELDFIRDANVRQDANGIQVTRIARIRQRGQKQNAQRLALEAPGLPRLGDKHPSWADLSLVDIQLHPIDAAFWDATLIYREPTENDLIATAPSGTVIDRSWFAVTITEQVNTDVSGERLYHWYSGFPLTPSTISFSGVIIGGVKFQRSTTRQLVVKNETAEIQRPEVGVRVVVVENENIERNIRLSGTVNAGRWSGYPEKTWLVGGLDSRMEMGRWLNTYELFYKPDTWRFRSVVEYFGAPPSDATLGNGIADFDVYASQNINLLPFRL